MRLNWLAMIATVGLSLTVQAADAPWRQSYQGMQATGEQVLGLWQFEANAPTADRSSHGHGLVLRGDSRFAEDGVFGSCLESFRSENDSAHGALIKKHPALSPKGAFTLELWVKPKPQFAAEKQSYFLDKQYYRREGDPQANKDYELSARVLEGGQHLLDTYLGFGADSAHYASSPVTLPVGQWTYIAFTYDGAGLGRFFVNGRPAGAALRKGRGAVASGPHPLVIGARMGSSNIGFPGFIDQVRITHGIPSWLNPQPTAVVAGGRSVYVRAEADARMSIQVKNPLARPLQGLRATFALDGVSAPDAQPLADIPALSDARADLPLDTLLKPGTYELLARIAGEAAGKPLVLEVSGTVTIVPRPLPRVLPVVCWGLPELSYKVTDTEALQEIGFTHSLLREGDVAHHERIWKEGKVLVPPFSTDQTLRQLDEQLAAGLKHIVQLQPGSWLIHARDDAGKARQAKYCRVNRDGEPYAHAAVCGLFPEVRRFCYNIGASAGQTFGRHPALDGALVHTEVAYGELCFHTHDRAAYRVHSGRDIPDEPVRNNTLGASRRGEFVPPDGIVADDHPIVDYYRWFWNKGDGWYDLHSQVHQGLKTGTHAGFWTFYDPAVRRPPVWGAGGDCDVLAHWTYTYPDPLRIGLATDELFAMADGQPGQRVMKMTQIIWYRRLTAPELPEQEKDRAQWELDDPEARFITIAPDHLREAFWLKLARPVQGIMYHGASSLGMGRRVNQHAYRYTNPEARIALTELLHQVAAPLGPTLMQVPDPPADVALLESFTSEIFGATTTWGEGHGWVGDMHLLLQWARLQPRVVYEEKIVRDGLDGFQVLVMPNCPVLPRGVYQRVVEFQARGGIVVGDQYLAAAVTPDIIVRQPAGGGAPDERKATLQALAVRLRGELAPLYAPSADSSDPDMIVRLRRYGDTDYLFAINDKRTYGNYVGHHRLVMEQGLRHQAVVSLARPGGTVYDLVDSRQIPVRSTEVGLEWDVAFGPGEGRVYMVTPRAVSGVRVEVAQRSPSDRAVDARVTVRDETGQVPSAVVPMRVDIQDPTGAAAEFSGYYGAKEGVIPLRLDLAANDTPGTWTIRARELASGKTTETRYTYEK